MLRSLVDWLTEVPPAHVIATKSALVVDPSRERRRAMASLLSDGDFDVITVASTREALEKVAAHAGPLVTFVSADRGGLELAKKLRAEPAYDRVRVVVLTKSGDTGRAFESGADACLAEPLDKKHVLEQTRAFLS